MKSGRVEKNKNKIGRVGKVGKVRKGPNCNKLVKIARNN